jgi:hypothetical protein
LQGFEDAPQARPCAGLSFLAATLLSAILRDQRIKSFGRNQDGTGRSAQARTSGRQAERATSQI